jgi:hypothetical protein
MAHDQAISELERLFVQKLDEKYQLSERGIKKAFSKFDKDNNGLLSIEELGDVMRLMLNGISEPQIRQLITRYDVDGDGKISYEEFVRLCCKQKEKRDPRHSRKASNLRPLAMTDGGGSRSNDDRNRNSRTVDKSTGRDGYDGRQQIGNNVERRDYEASDQRRERRCGGGRDRGGGYVEAESYDDDNDDVAMRSEEEAAYYGDNYNDDGNGRRGGGDGQRRAFDGEDAAAADVGAGAGRATRGRRGPERDVHAWAGPGGGDRGSEYEDERGYAHTDRGDRRGGGYGYGDRNRDGGSSSSEIRSNFNPQNPRELEQRSRSFLQGLKELLLKKAGNMRVEGK